MNQYIKAYNNIRNNNIIKYTNLELNKTLSELYNSNIYLKREDMQTTRSFKIRGAYNKIINNINNINNFNQEIVSVSAGNHAQGVALTCYHLNIKHHIFLPETTPLQKINRIKYFGKDKLNLHIKGKTFDDSYKYANQFSNNNNNLFIHPFNDNDVIFGQSTIGKEINIDFNKFNKKPNYIICPIGGGGLISGLGNYIKLIYPKCKLIGVEPINANSMQLALKNNNNIKLCNIDSFVDGASVGQIGKINFNMSKNIIDDIITIDNYQLSSDIIDIYQSDGIVLEPAGALAISALKHINFNKNDNIICLLSGGNNDISRYSDILEKKLQYLGLKHYYLIKFIQKPGQLKKFINNILENKHDITRFEYLKKTNKNYGSVLVGIELQYKNDIDSIEFNMNKYNFEYIKIDKSDLIYSYLI
jgi:threonine dehydratase